MFKKCIYFPFLVSLSVAAFAVNSSVLFKAPKSQRNHSSSVVIGNGITSYDFISDGKYTYLQVHGGRGNITIS